MFRQIISRFTVNPFVALLGKKQSSRVHGFSFETASQILPQSVKSWREIRSFAQNNGIIIGENEGRFAPEGRWISTFGVRSCRAFLCQTPEDRRYLAHVLPNKDISDYLPFLYSREKISRKNIPYAVFNGPELNESESRNSGRRLNEPSIISDRQYVGRIFVRDDLEILDFYINCFDEKINTIDVLFSPLGKVYLLEYKLRG